MKLSLTHPAIVAAIVSAVISIIGALLTNTHQSRQRARHEARTELKNWFRDVRGECRRLKSSTLRLGVETDLSFTSSSIDVQGSSEDVQRIEAHIDELERIESERPKIIESGETINEITKLTGRFRNPKGGHDPIESVVDLKDFVYDSASQIEDISEEEEDQLLRENRGFFEDLFWS